MLHQECDNALNVILECLSLVESTISTPEMVYKMFKGQKLALKGTKIGVKMAKKSWPLSDSPPARGENFDHYNLA